MMDVETYCDSIQGEVTEWKVKIHDAVMELDRIPSRERDKVSSQISDLHVIVDKLTDRLETLSRECPVEYGSQKQEIEDQMSELKTKWQDAWDDLSSLFGG